MIDQISGDVASRPVSNRAGPETVLVIGISGTGHGCGYWAIEACRIFKNEGIRVLFAESDPELVSLGRGVADAVYVGPTDRRTVKAIMAREHPDLVFAANGLCRIPGQEASDPPRTGRHQYEVVIFHDGAESFTAGTVETLAPGHLLAAPARSLSEPELKRLELLGTTALRERRAPPGGYSAGFGRTGRGGSLVLHELTRMNPQAASLAGAAGGCPVVEVAVKLAIGYRLRELRDVLPPAGDPAAHTLVRLGTTIGAGRDLAEAGRRLAAASGTSVDIATTGFAGPRVFPSAGEWGVGPLRCDKAAGLSDKEIALRRGVRTETIRELRHALGIRPGFPAIGDPRSRSCLFYPAYDDDAVVPGRLNPAVLIVGGRPATTVRLPGLDTVVITSSSEMLGGGHADRVYLAPITVEDVLEIVHSESLAGPIAGVLLQFGGAASLRLAVALHDAGVPVLGTPRESLESFVEGVAAQAVGVEVDALYDGMEVFFVGIAEQVGGIAPSAGPRSYTTPAISLCEQDIGRLRETTGAVAHRTGARGLVHVRYALSGTSIHVLDVVPGDSRTLAFGSAISGLPVCAAAAYLALGSSIAELRLIGVLPVTGDSGSSAGMSAVLRPDVSTGVEVMGAANTFARAFAEAMASARSPLPARGRVLVSRVDGDRRELSLPLLALAERGLSVLATEAPAAVLRRHGVKAEVVPGTEVAGLLRRGAVHLLVEITPDAETGGHHALTTEYGICHVTTIRELVAAVQGVQSLSSPGTVRPIHEFPSAGKTSRTGDALPAVCC